MNNEVIPLSHNEKIPEGKIGCICTHQDICDKFCHDLIPRPENYHNNWPPPPRPSHDEIVEQWKNSDVYQWLALLESSDVIREFDNIGTLCGSAGYVAFRDGVQVSAYDVWVS